MAIQTQGFQVRNMPQYTAPNPSLVAFNPTVAADGMLQTFQLAKQYEDLKSKKALQAELEATRKARIAQQNALAEFDVARTGAQMPTLQPKAGLELAQIEDKLAMMPKERAARESELLFKTAENTSMMPNLELRANAERQKTNADLRALEPVTNARIDRAVADSAQAQTESALSDQKRRVMGAQLELAQIQAQLEAAGAPAEAMLKMTKAAIQLGNAKTDEEYRQALKEVDMRLKESQIRENDATAAYQLGLGRQAAARGTQTPMQRAKDLQDLIRELDTMKIGDGKRTIGAYIADTFKDDGVTPKKNLIFKDPIRDPVADFYISQRQAYQQELLSLRSQIAPNANQPTQSTVSKPSGLPSVGEVVNGYRFKGGNPKDRNSWEKVN